MPTAACSVMQTRIASLVTSLEQAVQKFHVVQVDSHSLDHQIVVLVLPVVVCYAVALSSCWSSPGHVMNQQS